MNEKVKNFESSNKSNGKDIDHLTDEFLISEINKTDNLWKYPTNYVLKKYKEEFKFNKFYRSLYSTSIFGIVLGTLMIPFGWSASLASKPKSISDFFKGWGKSIANGYIGIPRTIYDHGCNVELLEKSFQYGVLNKNENSNNTNLSDLEICTTNIEKKYIYIYQNKFNNYYKIKAIYEVQSRILKLYSINGICLNETKID